MALANYKYNAVEEIHIEDFNSVNIDNQIYKKNKKNTSKANLKMKCIFTAIILLSLSLTILNRYATISRMRMDLNKLETRRTELQREKIDLNGQLEGIKSQYRIGEEAGYSLGMSYPNEGQVVYINVNSIETLEKGKSNNILGNIMNNFSKIF